MRARRLTLGLVSSMCVMAEVLSLGSASALAATPETPETIAASSITATTAVLHGVLNPNGEGEAGEYEFRYRPSATACEGAGEERTEPAPAAGHEAEVVQTSVGRLLPGTVYTFCVLARNQAFESTQGAPKTLTTPTAAPLVSDVSVADVGPTEAMLTAEIDPGAESTSYQVEYGSGERTPEAELPASKTPVLVQQKLTGLSPGTVYRFRFLARNDHPGGTEASGTFETTRAATSALALPDEREYELVSGTGNPGEVYVPYGPAVAPLGSLTDTPAQLPFRASAEGNAITYGGEPGEVGGSGKVGHGFGNQFIATRDPQAYGWDVSDVSPQPSTEGSESTEYQAFSPDLKAGILTETSPAFARLAQPEGPSPCDALYSRSNNEPAGVNVHALFTKTYEAGFCGERGGGESFELQAQKLQFAGANAGAGTTAPYSDLLFQTPASLTAEATRSPSGEGANLYDSSRGEVRMVNVLPDGQLDPNSVFGGRRGHDPDADFDNVISADGRRVFWTDLNPGGRLYMRENPDQPQSPLGPGGECTVAEDACTSALSQGEAQFWAATPDGRYVFYTEGETLWRYDSGQGSREELESTGAGVEGVIGASDDGSYLYFVAAAALPSEANGNGQIAEARSCGIAGGEEEEAVGHLPTGIGCNLYMWRAGQPLRFIAALAARDDQYHPGSDYQSNGELGDWQPELGSRTAGVTPSGNELAFESTQQLTGYDNSLLDEAPGGLEDGVEVFVYDAEAEVSKRLTCASCSPNGAAPVRVGEGRGATYVPISTNPTFVRRWLSEDGSRVFFNSSQPLVSQDENDAQDVYEWEQEGTGSCTTSTSRWGGCVFLLSGADSSDQSFFVDADASGDNVFFTHRGKLGQAGEADDKLNLFDTRVDGGFSQVRLSCTGTGCQGVPPAAPVFATPASVTFSGLGNLSPTPPMAPATKAPTRAQLLAKALKACRAKHDKRKRASCETQAKKRYGPAPKATRAHVKTKRSSHR
jgi:hypothetical protein